MEERLKDLSDRLVDYINTVVLNTKPAYKKLEKNHEECINSILISAYARGKIDVEL